MKIERITIEKALSQGALLPYSYICYYSNMYVGLTPNKVDDEEIVEARFFDENTEIKLFRQNGKLVAVCSTSETSDTFIEKALSIKNQEFGKEIVIKQLLDYDSDGQTYISQSVLSSWKGDVVSV